MGSILSKLFGGGNHNHRDGGAQGPPPALMPPPPSHSSTNNTLPRSISSTSSKHPTTPNIAENAPSVSQKAVKPAPINILEVEVDEEAFKETSTPIYTSTIKAQINPSPPHPLEQQKTLVAHLTTVEAPPKVQQSIAPIATLDSDYEDETVLLEQENAEIEEAVIKIQAGVRGYLVRKHNHENGPKSPPAKSISLDDSVILSASSRPQENILPPPEIFDTFTSSKPLLIQPSKTRVETPIPGSPPFAQDDTNYSILDTVDPQEEGEAAGVPLIANPEELEIFKKINEINQLLASKDEDDIAIVPEPPKQQTVTLTSSTMNSAFSSSSINNALSELDQTIREQELTLPPEGAVDGSNQEEEEVLVIESAFSGDENDVIPSVISPKVLVKAPSLDEETEEDDYNAELLDSPLLSETAAAIRIQAAYRGYEVRKSLSRDVSPARSTEEEKGAEVENEDISKQTEVLEEQQKSPEIAAVVAEEIKEVVTSEPVVSKPVVNVASVEEQQKFPEVPVKEVDVSEPVAMEPVNPDASVNEAKDDSPTLEEISEILSKLPEPVEEELFPVMEISDQEIIEDVETEKQITAKVSELVAEVVPKAQTASEEQQQKPLADIIDDVNVAVKEGFGTFASSVKAVEEAVAAAPVPDIEKSIKELEKSFDRDLLADVASEAAATVASPPTPVEAKENTQVSQQQQLVQTNEEESLISIEPPTPDTATQQQAPVFLSGNTEPLLPSKIPILDRANKSILKEPSSPEPHTYSNLSPVLSATEVGDESDEESCSISSPMLLRSSSPAPNSKKRPRRRGKKK